MIIFLLSFLGAYLGALTFVIIDRWQQERWFRYRLSEMSNQDATAVAEIVARSRPSQSA